MYEYLIVLLHLYTKIILEYRPEEFKKNYFGRTAHLHKNKKPKEKIPAVTTSDQWKQYFKNKEQEKIKLEAEKQQRKDLRESKKRERQRQTEEAEAKEKRQRD